MVMKKEDHENLLNELLSGDIDVSRKTEILQELRTDYGTVITEHETHTSSISKLQSEKDDLIVSNSKLFRQLGIVGSSKDEQEKQEEKTFSETITLESIEKSSLY